MGSNFKVTAQSNVSTVKRSKTATDRISDFKLATGDVLKRIGTAWRRAASSCNALAIDTFSSYIVSLGDYCVSTVV